MASPGVTDVVARIPIKKSPGDIESAIGFEISVGQDSWVAFGVAPDATQPVGEEGSARLFVRAREQRNVFCNPGDKVAWALA